MIIKQVLNLAIKKLKAKKITSACLDAEVLLSYVLKKTKEYLYTYPEKKITDAQKKKFFQLVARRMRDEPVAHIIGKKEFYGLDFFVDKNVLIPRPETELLVEEIINYLSVLPLPSSLFPLPSSVLRLADVGTGSGCLAITLAKHLPGAKIYATDISAQALKIARKNANLHQVKITFIKGNLLKPLKKINPAPSGGILDPAVPQLRDLIPIHPPMAIGGIPGRCGINPDIIVANLPYLDPCWIKDKSLKYEPKLALNGGKHGLKYFNIFLQQIKDFKLRPKAIFCEIDSRQTLNLKKIIRKILPHYSIQILKDLNHNNRIIKLTPKTY